MKSYFATLFSTFVCWLTVNAVAEAATPKTLELGASLPEFTALPTADGKSISANDLKQDVLVLVVTSNECPVARIYEARFVEFAEEHCKANGKVALVAVNTYGSEGNTLEDMKQRVEESKLNYPYAQDAKQELAKAVGATNTPHVFVFNKERKLVYKGAFDDNWSDPTAVKHRYVEEAVESLLHGAPMPKSTKAEGCPIQYER